MTSEPLPISDGKSDFGAVTASSLTVNSTVVVPYACAGKIFTASATAELSGLGAQKWTLMTANEYSKNMTVSKDDAKITVTVAGTYRIIISGTFSADASCTLDLYSYKNGIISAPTASIACTTSDQFTQASGLADLIVGDYIELWAASSSARNVSVRNLSMEMYRVST